MSNTDKVIMELRNWLTLEQIDKVLSHPLIRVLAEIQKPPFNPYFETDPAIGNEVQRFCYSLAQAEMLKAGYVKVEPKEEK